MSTAPTLRMSADEWNQRFGRSGTDRPLTPKEQRRLERLREAFDAPSDQPEADLWGLCRDWLEATGYSVPGGGGPKGRYWHAQQRRPSGITEGQPDVTVWRAADRRYFPVELKRSGREKPTDAQQDLIDIGATYRVNNLAEFVRLIEGE